MIGRDITAYDAQMQGRTTTAYADGCGNALIKTTRGDLPFLVAADLAEDSSVTKIAEAFGGLGPFMRNIYADLERAKSARLGDCE